MKNFEKFYESSSPQIFTTISRIIVDKIKPYLDVDYETPSSKLIVSYSDTKTDIEYYVKVSNNLNVNRDLVCRMYYFDTIDDTEYVKVVFYINDKVQDQQKLIHFKDIHKIITNFGFEQYERGLNILIYNSIKSMQEVYNDMFDKAVASDDRSQAVDLGMEYF